VVSSQDEDDTRITIALEGDTSNSRSLRLRVEPNDVQLERSQCQRVLSYKEMAADAVNSHASAADASSRVARLWRESSAGVLPWDLATSPEMREAVGLLYDVLCRTGTDPQPAACKAEADLQSGGGAMSCREEVISQVMSRCEEFLALAENPCSAKAAEMAHDLDVRIRIATSRPVFHPYDASRRLAVELSSQDAFAELWKYLVAHRYVVYEVASGVDARKMYKSMLEADVKRQHPATCEFMTWMDQSIDMIRARRISDR